MMRRIRPPVGCRPRLIIPTSGSAHHRSIVQCRGSVWTIQEISQLLALCMLRRLPLMASDGCQAPSWKTEGAFPHLFHRPSQKSESAAVKHGMWAHARPLPTLCGEANMIPVQATEPARQRRHPQQGYARHHYLQRCLLDYSSKCRRLSTLNLLRAGCHRSVGWPSTAREQNASLSDGRWGDSASLHHCQAVSAPARWRPAAPPRPGHLQDRLC